MRVTMWSFLLHSTTSPSLKAPKESELNTLYVILVFFFSSSELKIMFFGFEISSELRVIWVFRKMAKTKSVFMILMNKLSGMHPCYIELILFTYGHLHWLCNLISLIYYRCLEISWSSLQLLRFHHHFLLLFFQK